MARKRNYRGATEFFAEQGMPLSEFTLRTWVSRKKIPFIKLGKLVYFDEADLTAFIESHRVMPEVASR